MSGRDPIDSLIYLHRNSLLDWISERLGELFGDDPDGPEGDVMQAIDHQREALKDEMKFHFDGRTRYSTGVPFERVEFYPSTEPGPNGEDVPVVAQAHVQISPDGLPDVPPSGGVWEVVS